MSAENVDSGADVAPAAVDAPTVTVSVKPGRQLRQSSLFDFPAFRPKSHLEVADDLLMPSEAPRSSIAPLTVGVVSTSASGPVLVLNVGQGMGLSIPTLNNAVHYEATTPDGTTHSLRIGGVINPALPTQTVVVSHPSGITQSVTTVAQLQQEPRGRSGTKHTSLTYAQKLSAVKMLRKGFTKAEVMEKFHIALSTLQSFVKHEKKIREAIARGRGEVARIRQRGSSSQ